MAMKIIDINGTSRTEDRSDSFKPTGCLFFDTKAEANAYTDISNWGAGTMCYTASFEVAVLKSDGTWSWKE